MLDLKKRFGFFNSCIFIKELGICAASDLHIGLENELYHQGLIFPLNEEKILVERLKAVLERFHPSLFILAGDIFHSFDRIEWNIREKFDDVMDVLEGQCKVVLLKGSHDIMLSTLGIEVLDRYDSGDFTFAHGHTAFQDYEALIMGHEHPVIEIELERLPCFLCGEKVIRGKDLILLPAFNPLCQGVTINHTEGGDFMSPFLKGVNTGELRPVVEVQGNVLTFPKLQMLRSHMDSFN